MKRPISDIFVEIENFPMIGQKWPFYKNEYPNPSISVVSLISTSFAVENDLRNRSDAFLLNFYIFIIFGQIGQVLVFDVLCGIIYAELDRRIFSRK